MKNISIMLLLAGATTWSCTTGNTAENKAVVGKLPVLASPLYIKDAFEKDFLSKFKSFDLPTKTSTQISLGDTIPAKSVLQYILEPAHEAKLSAFLDFWGDNEELKETTRKGLEDRALNPEKSGFMVLNAGYGQRLNLHPNFYTLTFQIIPTFMEGGFAYTFLVNYDKAGKMMDAIQISANAGYVDMQLYKIAEITTDGLIKIESKNIKRGGMQSGTADFTELAYTHYKITDTGRLATEFERYTGFSGNFEGKEGTEIFKIEQYPSHLQVVYQPAPDMLPQVELEIIQFNKDTRTIIAKHPEKEQQFILTYDQDLKIITCKNSEGKQTNLSRKS